MTKSEAVTIGIAARNEEKTIRQSLLSALESLELIKARRTEIIVAVNGCTDNTEMIVREIIRENARTDGKTKIRMVRSEEGLIHAQRKIVESKSWSGVTIFLDADLLIEKNCIRELLGAISRDPDLQIAWAQVIPYDVERPSYKNLILNFADYYPNILTKRVYFSGRAFAVRDYEVPFASASCSNVDTRLADFLRLQEGPLIDDVYLSRAIIHEHGVRAIKYIPAAKVYFQPIASLKDFYYSQRRTIFERKRLNLLFPEHGYIVKKYYARTMIKSAYAKLSFGHRVAYRLYKLLYAGVRKIALAQYRVYAILLKQGLPLSSCKVWPALKTTKKAFQNETTD